MGFWQGLGRMIAGEPVYQASDKPREDGDKADRVDWQESVLPDDSDHAQPGDDAPQDVPPPVNDPYHDDSGQKIIPEVSVGRCETHVSGDTIELWIVIKNDSAFEIMLEKIVIFGTTMQLNRFMKPGEDREMMVYRGRPLKNGSYTKAQIMYKLAETGDYFCADQEIRYTVEHDGDYVVDEMHLIRPIHDR